MKILRVNLNNFRQYRGSHEILFSTAEDKHITVIQGENGHGKSNLMNAITWCLYGVELIASKDNDTLMIVNEREVYSNKKGNTLCEVSVTIGDDKTKIEFVRSQSFSILGKIIKEGGVKFEGFKITNEKGRSQVGDPEYYLNKYFVPNSLKSFFFFDGEKLFEHFQDTQKLKAYIEDLSQIEVLNRALNTASEAKKAIISEQRKVGTGQEKLADYNELEAIIHNNEVLLDQARANVGDLDDKIAIKDEYLRKSSNDQVKQLQNQRKEYESQRAKANIRKVNAETKLRSLLGNLVAPLYASKALIKTRNLIDENTKKGVLPPKIKDTFLKEILEAGVCVCGRELDDGSECRKKLEALLNEMVASDIATDAVGGKYVIDDILSKIDFMEDYSEISNELDDAVKDIEDIKAKLVEVSDKLGTMNIDEIREVEEERKALIRERDHLISEIGGYEYTIRINSKKKETLEHTIRDILKKNKLAGELVAQKKYLEDVIENMESIKHSLVDEVRIQLQDGIRRNYSEMISKNADDVTISVLDIGGRYKLSVKSEFGNEKIGSLSAGEKQVLALSVTAAMYAICKVDAPVLIDTPMGRISQQARENISDSLPNYLKDTQLIFLATDTEYTNSTREKLLPFVGGEYLIRFDDNMKQSSVIRNE